MTKTSAARRRALLTLADKKDLIFCGYSEASLAPYAEMGIETHVTNFNEPAGLDEAFSGTGRLVLISMPVVGEGRQRAQERR